MRESNVWNWVHAHVPSYIAIERFEVMYPVGGADCFFTDKRFGISGWLELKYCREDDKAYTLGRIPKLRAEQPIFLRRQAEAGVPAGILLRVEDTRWHLWYARKGHPWARDMASRFAVANADITWAFTPPMVEVFDALCNHHPAWKLADENGVAYNVTRRE